MFRTTVARSARLSTISRPFSTTTVYRKTPLETVKDAAKKVDRTVANAAVAGIEKGEQAANVIKENLPESTGQAKGQAKETLGEAKGKAQELKGEAKGKAQELKGEAKSKM